MQSVPLQRALILQQQRRYDEAIKEWQAGLAQEPHNSWAQAMLALCLAELERWPEATRAAQEAVQIAPDVPFAHYALANVLFKRDRLDEALAEVNEAIRLDPDDADHFALLAAIRHDQRNRQACLDAADEGLARDPEHIGCNNLRAMALVKLNRRDEAGQTIESALRRDPDNAVTHANRGWALLHEGKPREALDHFRESLRIDPGFEWAQAGIVEALKARNVVYRLMLKYFLFMAGLSDKAQWGIIIGGYIAYKILRAVARENPEVAPFIWPVLIAYIAFCLMSWMAIPLFNLLLRLDRFGRMALSRDQIIGANWFGVTAAAVVVCGIAAVFTGALLPILGAVYFFALLIPVSATFLCERGWPRTTMGLITIGLAIVGLAGLGIVATTENSGTPDLPAAALTLSLVFLIGVGLSKWIANWLMSAKPAR